MDLQTAYTSARQDVAAFVPPNATRLLELGCSTGATAAYLKDRQAVEIVGIERNAMYADSASGVLDRLLILDLDQPGWTEHLEGDFDCLIAADVLEHLVDPWAVLTAAVRYLRPDARVILSLPNIRHIQSLIGLARGRWPYRERGIHDATHLRFFTLREIGGLCAAAGLSVETVAPNYRFLDRPSRLDTIARAAGATPLKEFFAYQYVLAARVAPGCGRPRRETVPPWVQSS